VKFIKNTVFRKLYKSFFLALSFLTVVPVPELGDCSPQDVKESTLFFPLAGFFIGTVLLVVNTVFSFFCSPQITNLLIMLTLFVLTGGLHHDGLADTADALFSGRDREGMLRIMKDSVIGPMGAVSLIFSSFFFWQLLNELSGRNKALALVFTPVVARSVQVVLLDKIPYARPGGGTGALFTGESIPLRFESSIIIILTCFCTYSLSTVILNVIAVLSFTYMWGRLMSDKLGGITGDCVGAANEIVQILTLFLFVNNWGF